MPIKHIDALILFAEDIQRTVEFYRKLGLPLEVEDHGGPVHYACELGNAHVAVYGAQPGKALQRGSGGAAQIGFQVSNLDEAYDLAVELKAPVLIAPQSVPWGARFVIQDPDGRPVELNQARS